MHRPAGPAAACFLALALAACGGGSGTEPAPFPQQLIGHWLAGHTCEAAGCTITAQVAGTGAQLPLTDSITADLQIAAGGSVIANVSSSRTSLLLQGLARTTGSGTLVIDYATTPPLADTVAFAFQGPLLRFDYLNTYRLTVGTDTLRVRLSVLFARQ